MDVMTFIFFLLFALCTANQGGSRAVQVFFCKIPGCAENVTHVFCNDEEIFSGTHRIPDCTGLLPPNTTCQHNGRAFVSSDTSGNCDFEGNDYIKTEKCTGNHSSICAFINGTTSSPIPKRDRAISGSIIGGVCCVFIIVCISLCFWIKKKDRESARDSPNGGHRLEDSSSPSGRVDGP